jgi:hypothetical protein
MLTWKSDSSVIGRLTGWIGAAEVEGGRIDPSAKLSLFNFFIFPART